MARCAYRHGIAIWAARRQRTSAVRILPAVHWTCRVRSEGWGGGAIAETAVTCAGVGRSCLAVILLVTALRCYLHTSSLSDRSRTVKTMLCMCLTLIQHLNYTSQLQLVACSVSVLFKSCRALLRQQGYQCGKVIAVRSPKTFSPCFFSRSLAVLLNHQFQVGSN